MLKEVLIYMGYTHTYSWIDRPIYLYIQNTYPYLIPSYTVCNVMESGESEYIQDLVMKTPAPPICSLGSLAQGESSR